MKYNERYGVHITDEEAGDAKGEALMKIFMDKLTVTDHGTICRKDLKEQCNKTNKEGKNKDYSAGLAGKMHKMPRKVRQAKRYQDIVKLSEEIEAAGDKKGSVFDVNKLQKLRLFERGRFNLRRLK